jgi:methyl-accepting chemotaxis protein
MKGTIVVCLADMVTAQFGKAKWQAALEGAGLKPGAWFLHHEDIDDASVMRLVASACKTLDITTAQAADAFGDYWMNVYAPRIYKPFLNAAGSAREFLLGLDQVHVAITKNMPGARPPRFEYSWRDSNTLVMTYKSPRGMLDFVVGLAKGVGKYYKTSLTVTKSGPDSVQIVFP